MPYFVVYHIALQVWDFAIKSYVKSAVSSVVCVCLCVGVLLLSANILAFSKGFYNNQFQKNGSAAAINISEEDLDRVCAQLIAYLSGRSGTLQVDVTVGAGAEPQPFYAEKELEHMADVKTVFTVTRIVAYVLLGVGFAVLAAMFAWRKRAFLRPFALGAVIGGGIFLSLCLVCGIVVAVNFDGIFNLFHDVFFPQGNWQFNSSTSNMLKMLPEGLFLTAGVYIITAAGVFTLAMMAAGGVFLWRFKGKK